jgi:hypothetical protein
MSDPGELQCMLSRLVSDTVGALTHADHLAFRDRRDAEDAKAELERYRSAASKRSAKARAAGKIPNLPEAAPREIVPFAFAR